jgi:catechol 2,3-dioxygenase-like lactoylglutathione lyase family enzyme
VKIAHGRFLWQGGSARNRARADIKEASMLAQAKLQAMVGTARAEAAKAFYSDILGLALQSEDAFALLYDVGGAPLRISKVPATAPSAYAVLGFAVEDIGAVVAGLAAKGVAMQRFGFLPQDAAGIWKSPDGVRVAWFRDPDGNLLSVVQYA